MAKTIEIPARMNLTYVRLNCSLHHVVSYTLSGEPTIGEELWDTRCGKLSQIASLVPASDLRLVKCVEGCNYSRSHGTADLKARRNATSHAQRHPGHLVTVCDGDGKVLQESRRDEALPGLDF